MPWSHAPRSGGDESLQNSHRSGRRALLSGGVLAVATVAAGCLGGPPRTDGGSPSDGEDAGGDGGGGDDGSGDTRPSGTGGPGVSVAGVDDPPDLPVRPGVDVVREAATDDHPPGLRTTLENVTEDPVSVGEGRAVVFAYVYADGSDLVLLPASGDYPTEPGCWRLTDGIAVTEEYRVRTLDPGETVSTRVDLYGTPGEGCLPVGDYRFESTFSVAAGREAVPDGENGQSARWGFSVTLE